MHSKSSVNGSESLNRELAIQWNAKLDASLMQLVQKLGSDSWQKVAESLGVGSAS